MTESLVNVTLYSASHIGPIPTRFSWKPGITCPETGKSSGRLGMAISQVLDDLWASPEAVNTWIDGVYYLTFTLGACLVRYNPDAPESNISELLFLVRHIFHWFFWLPPHGGGTTGCNYFDVACVGGGGLQLCLENKSEEVCFPLYLFISNIIVNPRRHNNLLRQPGWLRWAFFLSF